MTMFMNKEKFIKEIEAMGFMYTGSNFSKSASIYIKNINSFEVELYVFDKYIRYWLSYGKTSISHASIIIAKTDQLDIEERTIEIIKILLKGLGDKIEDENNYTIIFHVEDMIKEAEFCGYKINEEQAKNLIDYLNRKADGVYETIQQYITGYCQNNKFEELKEE